jgi:hypothetical protein
MEGKEHSRKGCAALVLDHYLQRRAGVARIRQAWLPPSVYAANTPVPATCRQGSEPYRTTVTQGPAETAGRAWEVARVAETALIIGSQARTHWGILSAWQWAKRLRRRRTRTG